jgi:preprotein translocase subunit SecD
MLYFSRAKAAAILLTALVICSFMIPNFIPDQIVKSWPAWAQRRLVLGLDLQGGSHILLEVDRNDVRKQRLDSLRDEVVRTLRDAKITWSNAPAVRGNSVEVRIREGQDFSAALAKLRALSQPLGGVLQGNGIRTLDVTDAGGGLVRLAPTEAAMIERTRGTIDQSVPIIEKRINELGLVEPTVQRQGTDRILVQVPGLGDPQKLLEILGKTAKLEFRMVDTQVNAEEAAQGRGLPSDSEVLYEKQGGQRVPIVVKKQALVEGADLTDAQPGFDQQRTGEPIVTFKFNGSGARKFGRATQEFHRRERNQPGDPAARRRAPREADADRAARRRPRPRSRRYPCRRECLDRRRGSRGAVHAGDLRAVRPVRQHRGGGQRGDDHRHSVVPRRHADPARHRRHRADGRHRG